MFIGHSGEAYGLAILGVRGTIRLMDITSVPGMPVHMRGVIKLGGEVVPVIDLRLRLRLGMQQEEASEQSVEKRVIVLLDVGRLPSPGEVERGFSASS